VTEPTPELIDPADLEPIGTDQDPEGEAADE
jgi:hypothetical protein